MKPLPFVEAIAWAKAQDVVLPDVFYGQRMGQARANARTISGLASVDQIQSVFDKLDKVLVSGGTFADFKKAVQAGTVNIGLPTHRLELIYRNNIQSAYMGGRWQQVEQNKANRPYLQYSAINDGRTRPSHRKMHGFIARVDDKIWNEWLPLNGHRCRCSVLSLSEKQAKAIGISKPAKGKPDKGWNYNAGKTPSKGLEKAAKHKNGVVDDRLGGSIAKIMSNTDTTISKDKLEQWMKHPQGNVTIGFIPAYVMEALQAKTAMVVLSGETMVKQLKHHPELTLEEYMMLETMVNEGELIRQATNKIAAIHDSDKRRVIVLKATADGSEIFISTMFRLKSDREVRRFRKNGERL